MALLLAGVEHGALEARALSQAPPGQTQTPPQAGTQEKPQPAPAKPRTGRQGRTKRTPRTTARRPPATGSSAASRTSRNPGPSQELLTLSASVLGGYDDNVGASLGSGTGAVPGVATSGSTGYADLGLDYFRGTSARSLRVGSLGNLRIYPDYLDRPAPGGLAMIEATTPLGRKHTVRASERVRYEPLFTPGVADVGGVLPPPVTGGGVPATGLFERQSWLSTTTVSLERAWSRRDTTRVSYDYFTQRFTDDDRGNNDHHEATAEYRRRFERAAALRASYRYLDGRYTDYATITRPRTEQRLEGGPEYSKTLRGRQPLSVSLSLGAGATYLETVNSVTREPYDDWVPYASATATLSQAPIWSIAGGYQRGFSVLQGLTDQIYSTDTAYVTTSRQLMSRTGVAVGGTFADGRTSVASGVNDTFRVYGASALVLVSLTSTVAATAGYFYYQHRYSNPDVLPTGFPAEYERNAFRVGLTFWVPLAGTPSGPPPMPGASR